MAVYETPGEATKKAAKARYRKMQAERNRLKRNDEKIDKKLEELKKKKKLNRERKKDKEAGIKREGWA